MRDTRLSQIEDQLLDLLTAKAIQLARTVARSLFTTTLWAALPDAPRPGCKWMNLDLLSTSELWLLARWDNPRLPDIEQMSPGQLRAYVMQEHD
jgi:hypothetical protein